MTAVLPSLRALPLNAITFMVLPCPDAIQFYLWQAVLTENDKVWQGLSCMRSRVQGSPFKVTLAQL
jgi:hypothetical protein